MVGGRTVGGWRLSWWGRSGKESRKGHTQISALGDGGEMPLIEIGWFPWSQGKGRLQWVGQLFPLCLKLMQGIQVEMFRRQINIWALIRKLSTCPWQDPEPRGCRQQAGVAQMRELSDHSQETAQKHQKNSLMVKPWLYFVDSGLSHQLQPAPLYKL